MLTQITDRIPPLSILIPLLLVVWAGACTWLHGPAILAYVALQGATSGIFALSMYRISRRRVPAKSHDETGTDGGSKPAPASKRPVTV
ncbi:MAG: hypothetical protein HQ518_28765 [Rhodopirellula sp.]|nr:hypothetical protein [Rhodopirellula sp.]